MEIDAAFAARESLAGKAEINDMKMGIDLVVLQNVSILQFKSRNLLYKLQNFFQEINPIDYRFPIKSYRNYTIISNGNKFTGVFLDFSSLLGCITTNLLKNCTSCDNGKFSESFVWKTLSCKIYYYRL